ncbi:hypothetical protein DVR12_14545 [Chitinophaga silvatica]|uniref:Uncharacterized protein n=1 Tax=Chitinophaga silvatica TaxID=2282649 RepID=A0A3E1Y8X6_9BACT|nr:hypothetical protein [Chitinophaga silvatica]RFS21868.1 hypothetical protein DVR12_14545 [Chitinophaga silvatica]
MKILSTFLILCFVCLLTGPPKGNPNYDFKASIINALEFRHRDTGVYNSMVANSLCTSGYYQDARHYDSLGRTFRSVKDLYFSEWDFKEADKIILENADKYRVTMFNEEHMRPEHRLFVKRMLAPLRQKGYSILMVEGLKYFNELSKNPCPVSTDGKYINEPNYAQLLRYAKRLGYSVYAYEAHTTTTWDDSIKLDKYGSMKYIAYNPPDSMSKIYDQNGLKEYIFSGERENQQALNAYSVIRQHPNAKVVMMVGVKHISKDETMMQGQLNKMLHDSIITFDQTDLNNTANFINAGTSDTLKARMPLIAMNKATGKTYHIPSSFPPDVDFNIINEMVYDSLGRPSYLFKDPEKRKTYYLPKTILKKSPILVTAYYTNELEQFREKAIAVDIFQYDNADQKIPLLLFPADYTIVYKESNGEFHQYQVKIK